MRVIHPTPVRQWLISVTERCEFEAADVDLPDDLTGNGHQTRILGNEGVRGAII